MKNWRSLLQLLKLAFFTHWSQIKQITTLITEYPRGNPEPLFSSLVPILFLFKTLQQSEWGEKAENFYVGLGRHDWKSWLEEKARKSLYITLERKTSRKSRKLQPVKDQLV